MLYIGIDPGMSGALAIIGEDTEWNDVIRIYDAPTLQVKVGDSWRSRLNIPEMRRILWEEVLEKNEKVQCYAVLEHLQPQPKFGGRTNFWLGHSMGCWEAVLTGQGIPYQLVYAITWKKPFAIVKDERNKSTARAVALRLFPSVSEKLARVKDDGRAEALLIAEYARRTYAGVLQNTTPERPAKKRRKMTQENTNLGAEQAGLF